MVSQTSARAASFDQHSAHRRTERLLGVSVTNHRIARNFLHWPEPATLTGCGDVCLDPARGFEPQFRDSKSRVLPLDEAGQWSRAKASNLNLRTQNAGLVIRRGRMTSSVTSNNEPPS